MYKNIGKKIKAFTKAMVLIDILFSIIIGVFVIGLSMMSEARWGIIVGVAIIIIGFLVSWISSFVIYGFGELVDNVQYIKENINK